MHIGKHRAGTIDEAGVDAFNAVMDAAAFRDKLPVMPASLARRSDDPRYVVELAAPPGSNT